MNRQQQGYTWLAVSIVVAAAAAVVAFESAPSTRPPVVHALIATGQLALLIFMIPLFARPLRTLFRTPFTALLMRIRRNAGVAYGGVQLVHLVLVASMFVSLPDPPTETAMVIVGGAGLLLAMMMLWTSFDRPARAVGPVVWRHIHRAGFHIFMFIYLYDFLLEPLLLDAPIPHPLYVAALLSGMVLRTITWIQSRLVVAT